MFLRDFSQTSFQFVDGEDKVFQQHASTYVWVIYFRATGMLTKTDFQTHFDKTLPHFWLLVKDHEAMNK